MMTSGVTMWMRRRRRSGDLSLLRLVEAGGREDDEANRSLLMFSFSFSFLWALLVRFCSSSFAPGSHILSCCYSCFTIPTYSSTMFSLDDFFNDVFAFRRDIEKREEVFGKTRTR